MPKRLPCLRDTLNYLSWRVENPGSQQSILVLNSLALLNAGIAKAKEFSSINLYLDRDKPGFDASKDFIKALPYATDRSSAYEGFNDYNDKLVSGILNKPDSEHIENKQLSPASR